MTTEDTKGTASDFELYDDVLSGSFGLAYWIQGLGDISFLLLFEPQVNMESVPHKSMDFNVEIFNVVSLWHTGSGVLTFHSCSCSCLYIKSIYNVISIYVSILDSISW